MPKCNVFCLLGFLITLKGELIQYYGKHALTPDGSEKLLFPCPQESSVAFPPTMNGCTSSRLIKSTWWKSHHLICKLWLTMLETLSIKKYTTLSLQLKSIYTPTIHIPPPQTRLCCYINICMIAICMLNKRWILHSWSLLWWYMQMKSLRPCHHTAV